MFPRDRRRTRDACYIRIVDKEERKKNKRARRVAAAQNEGASPSLEDAVDITVEVCDISLMEKIKQHNALKLTSYFPYKISNKNVVKYFFSNVEYEMNLGNIWSI